jgi:hypothetical protein
MYQLLMTAALLVGMAGSVCAQSLPFEFRGVWCGSPDVSGSYFRPRGSGCPDSSGEDIINVTADGYRIEESDCKAINLVVSPVRRRLRFSCSFGETEEWRLVDGKLWRKMVEKETRVPMEYTCAGYEASPPEAIERDPVMRTSVIFPPFDVRHTTLAGEVNARMEQYRDVRTWSNRDGDFWSGVSTKNPRRTMVGQLAWDDTRGISARRYVEKSFIDGRVERTVVSTCVQAEG